MNESDRRRQEVGTQQAETGGGCQVHAGQVPAGSMAYMHASCRRPLSNEVASASLVHDQLLHNSRHPKLPGCSPAGAQSPWPLPQTRRHRAARRCSAAGICVAAERWERLAAGAFREVQQHGLRGTSALGRQQQQARHTGAKQPSKAVAQENHHALQATWMVASTSYISALTVACASQERSKCCASGSGKR